MADSREKCAPKAEGHETSDSDCVAQCSGRISCIRCAPSGVSLGLGDPRGNKDISFLHSFTLANTGGLPGAKETSTWSSGCV